MKLQCLQISVTRNVGIGGWMYWWMGVFGGWMCWWTGVSVAGCIWWMDVLVDGCIGGWVYCWMGGLTVQCMDECSGYDVAVLMVDR